MSRMACPRLWWIGFPIALTFFCGGAYLLAAQRPSPRGQVFDKLIALVNSAPLCRRPAMTSSGNCKWAGTTPLWG